MDPLRPLRRLAVVVVAVLVVVNDTLASRVVPWRSRRDYPKDLDRFEMFLADQTRVMSGERAVTDGCGPNRRPYKYRGKAHIAALRSVLQGVMDKVWVGAVDTTTPWAWSDGRGDLHQLVGLTSSDRYTLDAITIPGNNAFLCSLHCGQMLYILLQGYNCACSETRPDTIPISGDILKCPGSYDNNCGTFSSYAVYKNMLAGVVQWSVTDTTHYYGTRAYLFRSTSTQGPSVQLGAEVNPWTQKSYVCNGTVVAVGSQHIKHMWAETSKQLTWKNAQHACMNQGRQLVTLSRDTKDCMAEVEPLLKTGKSYWIGLSRQTAHLWLDGTQVKTTVNYHHRDQSACLAMSLGKRGPTFTFESCTGTRLQVLCERDINPQTFMHDAEGNHIVTKEATDENDYSDTVAILIGILVMLSLLSAVLVVFICNRERWLPRKPSTKSKPHTAARVSQLETRTNGGDCIKIKHDTKLTQGPHCDKACSSCNTQPGSYAVVNKTNPSHTPSSEGLGNGKPRLPQSDSFDYTEVHLSSDESCDEEKPARSAFPGGNKANHHQLQHQRGRQVTLPAKDTLDCIPRRDLKDNCPVGSVKMIDYCIDSSQSSSVAGSDDAYSVLGYRKAIKTAYSGFAHSAYSHIMLGKSAKSGHDNMAHTGDDAGDNDYDIASHGGVMSPRVPCIDNDYDHTVTDVSGDGGDYDIAGYGGTKRIRCIDNDYDHAEPQKEHEVKRPMSYSRSGHQIVLGPSNRNSKSEV